MGKMLLAAISFVMVGSASAAVQPSSYGVLLTSKLAQTQYMTVSFEGTPTCFGDLSAGKPVQCESVSHLPRMITVNWGAPANWENPGSDEKNLPPGWKIPHGTHHQKYFAQGVSNPPGWFQSGDIVVFTINGMHQLSVTYQCHRPGDVCVNYPPVTAYGEPQGVASVLH